MPRSGVTASATKGVARPLRLLHVIPTLGQGGAEAMLTKLATRLDQARFDQTVVCLRGRDMHSKMLEAAGIDVCHLDLSGPISLFKALRKLRAIVGDTKADVVHGWMYHGALAAILAAGDRPAVCGIRHSLHDLRLEKKSLRAVIWVLARLSNRFAAITYNSRTAWAQHSSQGFCDANASYIPNGFDCNQFRPNYSVRAHQRREYGVQDDVLVILHVARNHPMKDQKLLIKAATELTRQHRIRVMFAGAGCSPDKPPFRGLDPSVFRCLDQTDDVVSLMQMSDCLCLTSAWGEGFPNVIGEALAAGLPIVATDVGDCKHLLKDLGWVIASGDKTGLIHALEEIIHLDLEYRSNLEKNMRLSAHQSFDIATVVTQHADLYERLQIPDAS